MNSDIQKYMPHLRVEKTNTTRDDLRVMISGVLVCIFLIMVQPFVFLLYDSIWAQRPFVTASVAIYHVEGRENPMLLYDADATQAVDGIWIASIYAASDDARMDSRRGSGSYNSTVDEGRLWTWQAFFDNEVAQPPQVPTEPFYICVRYIVEARDSGADDESPPNCSITYDPNNPTLLPETGEITYGPV